jgi:hypothetical protein
MIYNFKLFELITSPKETSFKFEEFRGYYHHDLKDYRYIFQTKSGSKYKLDLKASKEKNIIFDDKTELKNYSLTKYKNTDISICYVISYTLIERNHINYDDETNKFEHFELLGKVVYLLQDFMKKFSNYNIFIMYSNNDKKIKFYSNYFNNFKLKFYKAESLSFNTEVFYLIF